MPVLKEILLKISNASNISSLSSEEKEYLKSEILNDHEFRKKISRCIMQYICSSSIYHNDILKSYLSILSSELNVTLSDIFSLLGANEMYWFLEHAPLYLLHDLFSQKCFVASCTTSELLVLQKKRPELGEFYKTHFEYCPRSTT